MAAEPEKKKVQKRTDPAVKRDMLGKQRRMYNKARKSACATRIKKVRRLLLQRFRFISDGYTSLLELDALLLVRDEAHSPPYPHPQVITFAESLVSDASKAEAEVPSLERLISEAYCEIDKAVTKGVLHKNNAARKKARCARYKRKVLIMSGLWTPPADHPDFKLVAKAKKTAA